MRQRNIRIFFRLNQKEYKIGNNLNQISLKAHTMNVIDVKWYDEAMCLFKQTVRFIMEAVILPRPVE